MTGTASPTITCCSPTFHPPRKPGATVKDVSRDVADDARVSTDSGNSATASSMRFSIGMARQIVLADTWGGYESHFVFSYRPAGETSTHLINGRSARADVCHDSTKSGRAAAARLHAMKGGRCETVHRTACCVADLFVKATYAPSPFNHWLGPRVSGQVLRRESSGIQKLSRGELGPSIAGGSDTAASGGARPLEKHRQIHHDGVASLLVFVLELE